ncbi:hypothetical protein CK203_073422 [Vitis vinifera]|uniref:Uncharacterized protein n=1 Tax=Vitis vinifera TaxID=29760 RepID=A0A438EK91_VITVI|nr:hypothetical protein CK203_073422 [Vitis vinifera]
MKVVSRPLLGDTLVIAGTLCIAMSNVGEVGNLPLPPSLYLIHLKQP